MKSLTGKLLVASPKLRDPNFFQTVVLMIQHESQGALGLILNRPSDHTVKQAWELLGNSCPCEEPIYIGGPVPGPVLAVHTYEELADQMVLPGLFVTGQNHSFEDLFLRDAQHYRFFSGNSGWASGQLEAEMQVGGWLTTSALIDDVFSDYETLWKTVTTRIGLNIAAPGIHPDQLPPDPSMN